MRFTEEPRIYHVATSTIDLGEINRYLMDEFNIRAEETPLTARPETDYPQSDAEILTQLGGRMCYRSFQPGLNTNVTKVREDPEVYFRNLLASGHGSVLEHAYDTFIVVGCSRVFTHEVVRHRLCNFSQESLRYVALEDIPFWMPPSIDDPEPGGANFTAKHTIEAMEQAIATLKKLVDYDDLESFDAKKKFTSAFRRLAPIGLATSIMITTNHRNWRHMIQMRTDSHAEEEIRLIMGKIAAVLADNNPLLYQDMRYRTVDGAPDEFYFENVKV